MLFWKWKRRLLFFVVCRLYRLILSVLVYEMRVDARTAYQLRSVCVALQALVDAFVGEEFDSEELDVLICQARFEIDKLTEV